MINRLPDITDNIDSKAPFKHCALGRQPYAELLTEIVRNTEQGVISLNGDWGTGKTTFVRMWKAHLEAEDFTTLYFNVWDNDYSDDPMVSLMSQLYSLFKHTEHKKQLKDMLCSFAKVMLSVGKPIGKGLVKKITGTDLDEILEGLKEATDISVDELVNLANKALDKVAKEKEDLEAFRAGLQSFVSHSTKEIEDSTEVPKPIVCFIDELDRCNPKYAVLVLERIKHIFSVHGIVFVLSIDKKQLGNSIRGYYGSDLIDADEYLRRFIDLDLNMPPMATEKFFKYLYKSFNFQELFAKRKGDGIRVELENFKLVGELLIERSGITLRQAEKMMSHLHLVLNSLPSHQYFRATDTAILVYLRCLHSDVYKHIQNKSYSIQELISTLENEFKTFFFIKNYNSEPVSVFIDALAEIVCMYDAEEHGRRSKHLIERNENGCKLTVDLHIIPREEFLQALDREEQVFKFGTPSLHTIINNIEMIGNLLY